VLAKNFGLDPSVFESVPSPNPYIFNATVSTKNVTDGPAGELTGDASFVYKTLQHEPESVPGQGGVFYKIDSTNFPASKTIAATFVRLEPGGLRELHWHPNVSYSRHLLYLAKRFFLTGAYLGRGVALLSQRKGTSDGIHWERRGEDL